MLNAYRLRRGLTIADLAVELGVSTGSAGRYVLRPGATNHKRPNRAASEKLRTWSNGLIDSANYADLWTEEIDAAWTEAGVPRLEAEPTS